MLTDKLGQLKEPRKQHISTATRIRPSRHFRSIWYEYTALLVFGYCVGTLLQWFWDIIGMAIKSNMFHTFMNLVFVYFHNSIKTWQYFLVLLTRYLEWEIHTLLIWFCCITSLYMPDIEDVSIAEEVKTTDYRFGIQLRNCY